VIGDRSRLVASVAETPIREWLRIGSLASNCYHDCGLFPPIGTILHVGIRKTNSAIGGRDGAAARLGLKRTTLIYMTQRHGISRPSLDSNAAMTESPSQTLMFAAMGIAGNWKSPARYAFQKVG
jgi:hypothetical protein